MIHGRRSSDRRRRVLYTAHHADNTPTTAASRRDAQRMREARRPTAAYGIRVQRRLRGRWFSVVPVRRTTLITMSAAIGGWALFLCFLHYASVAWPSIAYRPEIARPLRLDRPDSFGRLYACMLLAGSAGLSLLTYQLRRYRIDDYQGRYRLWRLVLVVLVLASINTQVSLIQWGGALLDAGFGRRVALTGSDWLRLVVSIGGAILALRLCAEVRRCRWALISMIGTCGLLAIPEAAKWNFITVESISTWTLVTSAPLLASSTLFISLAGYLRMLYREVRQIEDGESLADRVNQFRLRVLSRADRDDEADAGNDDVENQSTRPSRSQDDPDQRDKATPRRRWFGLRRAKEESSDSKAKAGKKRSEKSPAGDEATATKKRSRFSLRLNPQSRAAKSAETDETAQAETKDDPSAANANPKKRGLGGWLRSKQPADGEDSSVGKPSPSSNRSASTASSERENDDEIDPDEIDWGSMSKSERRRLRKKLRRQGGQAA